MTALLAGEERLEILEPGMSSFADVVIGAGVAPDQLPDTPAQVIVLSEEPEAATWAPEVRAWLPLNALASEIAAAVIAAATDLTVLTGAQARRWLPGSEPGRGAGALIESLTPRELQVLRMLAEGLANKQIADRLSISENTAKFHVAQILGKLGVSTRAQAVAAGIRRGLVPI